MFTQAVERITAEYEQRTSEIGNTFDKLLFLTRLQKWLAARHQQVFHEWVSTRLEEQYGMLAPRYREAAETGELPPDAFSLPAFSRLIPAGGIEEGPRVLFYSNLDTLLDILREELPARQQPVAAPQPLRQQAECETPAPFWEDLCAPIPPPSNLRHA
jgi:hypothetical protein